MSSPGSAWGTGLPAALYARLRLFLFAYKRNGRVGIWFWCVSTLYTMYISLGLRRANRLPGGSLLAVVAILVRVQVERKGGNFGVAFF